MRNQNPVIKNYIISPDAFVFNNKTEIPFCENTQKILHKSISATEKQLVVIFISGILLYRELLKQNKV